jgi:peptidoglycan/LPS O-acetylase OafA/YrhL
MREKPNLDLLRTVAVACVLLDHFPMALGVTAWHGLRLPWLGVFGVYLFFVHTCLVLMWSLERQPHVLNFYIRRAFRIYPVAIVATVTALLFPHALNGPMQFILTQQHLSLKTIVANLLLVQNLLAQPNIVGVTWSLPMEVEMYIVLPLLYLYAAREKKLWPLLLLWLLAVAQAAGLRYFGNFLPTVIPDFLAGVIAYVGFQRFRPVLPGWSFGPWLLLLGGVYMISPGVVVAWPMTLALGLTLPLFRQLDWGWSTKLFHTVAKYSYGIYIAHTFMITLVCRWMARFGATTEITVALLLTAAVAFVSYHLIEDPMIRAGSRIARANDRRQARALELVTL